MKHILEKINEAIASEKHQKKIKNYYQKLKKN